MLDNVTKDMANEFLLSLNLIDEKLSDKEKIRKLYTLSNNIEKNYKKTETGCGLFQRRLRIRSCCSGC